MQITGTIKHVFDTEQVNDKFKKRTVVLTTKDGQYEQHIPIEFVQDNVDKLNDVGEGQEATIHINLRGREWNDKYFVNVQGWKIEVTETETNEPPF